VTILAKQFSAALRADAAPRDRSSPLDAAPGAGREVAHLPSSASTRLSAWLRPGTIPALDGVRALACLAVMGYHINLIAHSAGLWVPARHPLIASILLSGSSGVTLFFVLSGFLLFLPYVRAMLVNAPWPDARIFYVRRALRILPGYYASLFLIVMLQQPQYLEPRHWRDLLLFLLLLMDATPATFQRINGPYWTLAIEWQFYLLLPLIALGIRFAARRVSGRRRVVAVMACLGGLVAWGLISRLAGAYLVAHPAATLLVPRRWLNAVLVVAYGTRGKSLEDFAVGMLAATCYTLSLDPARARFTQVLRRLSPWLWGAGLLMLACAATQLLPHLMPLTGALYVWANELNFALGFGCCMLAILAGARPIRRCFEWAPLCAIGAISYSLYIWHLPLLVAFATHALSGLRGLPRDVIYASYWAWALLVVIPVTAAMYVLIEQPGMRLSERLRQSILARTGARRDPSVSPALAAQQDPV
jgi:peptidoglycan/LPS O-acetylase OafA/YrhL